MKLLLSVCIAILFAFSDAKLREGDCEVCLKAVNHFIAAAKTLGKKVTAEKIEQSIRKECKGFTDLKDKRLCYYIGGTEDSATGMLRTLSGPIQNGLPSERICEKLKKADFQICELRYDKPIDVDTMDLKKARVKDLKNVLSLWGEKCNGCTGKADYVKRIEELKPKYAAKKEM